MLEHVNKYPVTLPVLLLMLMVDTVDKRYSEYCTCIFTRKHVVDTQVYTNTVYASLEEPYPGTLLGGVVHVLKEILEIVSSFCMYKKYPAGA